MTKYLVYLYSTFQYIIQTISCKYLSKKHFQQSSVCKHGYTRSQISYQLLLLSTNNLLVCLKILLCCQKIILPLAVYFCPNTYFVTSSFPAISVISSSSIISCIHINLYREFTALRLFSIKYLETSNLPLIRQTCICKYLK